MTVTQPLQPNTASTSFASEHLSVLLTPQERSSLSGKHLAEMLGWEVGESMEVRRKNKGETESLNSWVCAVEVREGMRGGEGTGNWEKEQMERQAECGEEEKARQE